MEKALGRELPASAEIRQRQELEQQNQRKVHSTKDVVVDALPQTSPESSLMPLNPINDGVLHQLGFNAVRGDCGRSRKITFVISRKL